jgi:exopolysaccharide production protein ExoQ
MQPDVSEVGSGVATMNTPLWWRRSRLVVAPARGQQFLAAITAVWLVLQMFDVLFTIGGSYELALTVCVVWIALPLFFAAPQAFLRTGLSALMAGKGRSSVLLMVFFVVSLASALMSGNILKSVGYLVATIVTLMLEYELRARLGGYFNSTLRWYSVLGTLAYLPFYWRGALAGVNWGRLSVSEADHPNHFGLVCFSIIGAAFAWRNWPVRLTISGVMIAMIMAAQSRSALISGLVTIAAFILLELKNRKAALTAIVSAGLACMAVSISLEQITGAVSSVLNLQDQYRGTASGLSGRVDVWRAGIDIFLDHPLLGVGFRLQDEALPARFQALGAVHNGFLGTLVEVGLLGAIPLFWFMGIGVRNLWRDSDGNHPGSQLGLSYVLGYLASALVEPRLLNLANPASVIAWCFLISSGIQYQWGRKARPRIRARFVTRLRTPMPCRRAPATSLKDWSLILKVGRSNSRESNHSS